MLKVNYSYKNKSKTLPQENVNLENITLGAKLPVKLLSSSREFLGSLNLEEDKIVLVVSGASSSTGMPRKTFVDRNTVKKIKLNKKKNTSVYQRVGSKYLSSKDSQLNIIVKDLPQDGC